MKLPIAAAGFFCVFAIASLLLTRPSAAPNRASVILAKFQAASHGRPTIKQKEEAYWRQLRATMGYFSAHKPELNNVDLLDTFAPFYTCDLKERIGHPLDGGKWICDVDQLRHRSCVVFSLGSMGETSFEEAILDRAPGCAIHTYDNTLDLEVQAKVEAISGITFHGQGIYSEAQLAEMQNGTDLMKPLQANKDGSANVTTLARAMAENNAPWVDVLKIDIEGSEWPVFGDLLARNDTIPITQILIELHFSALDFFPDLFPGSRADALERFFSGMWRHQYRAFSAELNLRATPADFIEYSFIKVDNFTGHIITGR